MTKDALSNENINVTKNGNFLISPSDRIGATENVRRVGLVCPNCGADLEARKCKLLCVRVGCGYQVTCSEW